MSQDAASFICPECRSLIEVGADKASIKHSHLSVPLDLAERVVGKEVVCDQCFSSFVVQQEPFTYVILKLSPKA